MADKKYIDKIIAKDNNQYYIRASALAKDVTLEGTENLALKGITIKGDSETSNKIEITNETISGLSTPSENADAANKEYVDDTVATEIAKVVTNHETWTFTLKSGETITKEIAVWTSQT